jgi:hypothetical protein
MNYSLSRLSLHRRTSADCSKPYGSGAFPPFPVTFTNNPVSPLTAIARGMDVCRMPRGTHRERVQGMGTAGFGNARNNLGKALRALGAGKSGTIA